MDLGTYMFVDAEIWFGDRFWGVTKSYVAIFEILIFCDSSGGQNPKFVVLQVSTQLGGYLSITNLITQLLPKDGLFLLR